MATITPDAAPTPGSTPQEPGPGEKMSLEIREVAGLSQAQIVRKRFVRHRAAMVSLVVLILVLLLAATSIGWGPIPGWWIWGPEQGNVGSVTGERPTLAVLWIGGPYLFHMGLYPFGVSGQYGFDNFAQVMRGIQQTTIVIVVVGLISTVLGAILGAVAGFFRGWIDSVVMRLTDLIITLPLILITAVLGVTFHATGVLSVALALGFFSWMGLARLVRAEFLTLREREFVDAARVAGASSWRIIRHHILPNTVSVIVVNATLTMSSAILIEAALSFLGFGIQYPNVSLGSLISNYQTAMLTNEGYLFIWPGVFIVIIVMTLNFIGDGIRDAYDPRQKRVPKKRELKRSDTQSEPAETDVPDVSDTSGSATAAVAGT